MSQLRGEALWRYRQARGIQHPDAGRKLFDLTASERKQRAREQRYRLRLIDMELAGLITPVERRRAVADLNRAARRRSGS